MKIGQSFTPSTGSSQSVAVEHRAKVLQVASTLALSRTLVGTYGLVTVHAQSPPTSALAISAALDAQTSAYWLRRDCITTSLFCCNLQTIPPLVHATPMNVFPHFKRQAAAFACLFTQRLSQSIASFFTEPYSTANRVVKRFTQPAIQSL